MAMTPLQLAALNGRDPSQRSQVLDSRNLITSDYNAPNWMTGGNGTGMWGAEHGNVPLTVGQNYALYDNKTGKVLARGSTAEELQNILGIIDNQLVPQGNDADWRLLQMGGPQESPDRHTRYASPVAEAMQIGDEWGTPVAGDVPNNFVKDMLVPMLTPIAGAALGYFGGNALLGAGGAGGGAGAGGLGSITGSSAGNAALASLANVPIAAGLPATTAGLGAGVSAIGGAAGAGGGTLGGVGLGSVGLGTSTAGLTPIVVPGIKGGLTFAQTLAGLAPGLGITGAGAALGSGSSAGTGTSTAAGPDDVIEVVGQPVKPYIPPITIPPVFTNIPPVNAPELPTDLGSPELPGKAGPKVPWGRIISGVLGGLGGAAGSGSTPYIGSGNRDPIFSAKLPPASLPGGVSSMSARAMPEQNWYEYGFHPEQSFFNTSAPGYTPEPGKTPGMARGGDFAVKGPGDGRSDSIPARLSDGEYVMDAETVALLGDGSSKAGAQKLDQFRVNLRKQKGRNLARGKFSVKAKRPETYLAGGRT
jgi:hypothetical protein